LIAEAGSTSSEVTNENNSVGFSFSSVLVLCSSILYFWGFMHMQAQATPATFWNNESASDIWHAKKDIRRQRKNHELPFHPLLSQSRKLILL
jgi:hypothetical protein